MPTDELQDLWRRGLSSRETGEAVGEFVGGVTAASHESLHLEDLCYVGPAWFEIVGQSAADAKAADFQASVAFVDGLRLLFGQVWEGAIGKQECDIVIQLLAILFGNEEVVRLFVAHLLAPVRGGVKGISTQDMTSNGQVLENLQRRLLLLSSAQCPLLSQDAPFLDVIGADYHLWRLHYRCLPVCAA